MNFFFDLKSRYAPTMGTREFSEIVHELEMELFENHPEYLELPEKEQNIQVEDAYRRKWGKCQ